MDLKAIIEYYPVRISMFLSSQTDYHDCAQLCSLNRNVQVGSRRTPFGGYTDRMSKLEISIVIIFQVVLGYGVKPSLKTDKCRGHTRT